MSVKDLDHYADDVRSFYEQFKDEQTIVGYESSGYARWFEQLLFELKIEVWVGDATEIHRLAKRRQKNDRRDSEHILELMLKGEFPKLYRTSARSQEILRLLRRRHKLVKHRDDDQELFTAHPDRNGFKFHATVGEQQSQAETPRLGVTFSLGE